MWSVGHAPQRNADRFLGKGGQQDQGLQEVAHTPLPAAVMLQSPAHQQARLIVQCGTCKVFGKIGQLRMVQYY